MSLQQLGGRLTRLEVQRRPWVVADILQRARQCAPSEVGAFLIAALTTVDRATAAAIMDQLTDAERAALDAQIGPELLVFLEMLPASELEAITRGDPVALQRVSRSYQRWRNGRT